MRTSYKGSRFITRTCAACGKKVVRLSFVDWAYVYEKQFYCSYACLRKAERENEERCGPRAEERRERFKAVVLDYLTDRDGKPLTSLSDAAKDNGCCEHTFRQALQELRSEGYITYPYKNICAVQVRVRRQ